MARLSGAAFVGVVLATLLPRAVVAAATPQPAPPLDSETLPRVQLPVTVVRTIGLILVGLSAFGQAQERDPIAAGAPSPAAEIVPEILWLEHDGEPDDRASCFAAQYWRIGRLGRPTNPIPHGR